MFLDSILSYLENDFSLLHYKDISDPFGIQFGDDRSEKKIQRVMITLDLTIKNIHFAVKNKINLIISQHGLFNNPINKFNRLLTQKLSLLMRYPISIYVLDKSYLVTSNGILDNLIEILYLDLDKPYFIKNEGKEIPIGRICGLKYYPNQKCFTFNDFLNRLKTNLDLASISYSGKLDSSLKKIFLIADYDLNTNLLEKLTKSGCNCIITNNYNHFEVLCAEELDINMIYLTNYQFKSLGLKKLYNLLSLEFPRVDFFWCDSIDPIKTLFYNGK